MRNFTLLLIGGLLSSGLAHGQKKADNRLFVGNRVATEVMYQMPGSKSSQLQNTYRSTRASETAIWKPYKEYGYEYNPALEDPWVKTLEFSMEYDTRGNETYFLSEESDGSSRTYTTYDENSMKTETITQDLKGDRWLNTERRVYAYDKIVTDFVIEQTYYGWDEVNEEWKISYSHKYDIERDSEGRITKKTRFLLYLNEYEVHERAEITYGDDGKAKTWTMFRLMGYNEDGTPIIEEAMRYENMEWENTNGQIIESHEVFMLGDNRMKKATRYDNGEHSAEIEITYTPEKRDFRQLTTDISGEEAELHFLTTLDDNGSYREETQDLWDMNGDGKFTDDEIMYRGYVIEMCDENKNPVSTEEFETFEPELDPDEMMAPITRVEPEEDVERLGGTLTEYTYGEDNRILEQIMRGWNYNNGVYEIKMKKVSADFRDVTTGLETTRTESGKLTYSVTADGEMNFSMEGMSSYAIYNVKGSAIVNAKASGNAGNESIAQLPAGLYILKVTGTKGTETVKFLKR